MGLDMQLIYREAAELDETTDKFGCTHLHAVEYERAYWRKHAPLHQFIVDKFNGGEDNCQPIFLDEKQLKKLAAACKSKELHSIEDCGGFFFGSREMWEQLLANGDKDAEIFESAANFLREGFNRSVFYQASW